MTKLRVALTTSPTRMPYLTFSLAERAPMIGKQRTWTKGKNPSTRPISTDEFPFSFAYKKVNGVTFVRRFCGNTYQEREEGEEGGIESPVDEVHECEQKEDTNGSQAGVGHADALVNAIISLEIDVVCLSSTTARRDVTHPVKKCGERKLSATRVLLSHQMTTHCSLVLKRRCRQYV